MNPWQMAQQLKHRLATAVWPTGSGDLVFGTRGVRVFAGTPKEEDIPPNFPWCLVGIDSGTPDDDHPELIQQGFTLLSAAEVSGDPTGEFAIIGGAAPDLGKSAGRGVGEIATRVRAAVGNLLGSDGALIMVSQTSTGAATPLGRGLHIVLDENTVTAACTSDLHYAAPQEVSSGAGTWTWEGAHCSDRFDFLQYRLVVNASNVPQTPADGTTDYTGAAATFVGGSGGGFYTVFADYNARSGTTVDGSSSPEVGSFI